MKGWHRLRGLSVAGSNLHMLVKTRGGNLWAAMRQIDADLSGTMKNVLEPRITRMTRIRG